MNDLLLYIAVGVSIISTIIVIVVLIKLNNFEKSQNTIVANNNANQKIINDLLDQRLSSLISNTQDSYRNIQTALNAANTSSDQRLDNIRQTLDTRVQNLQNENTKKLDEIRSTVDEKLQKTLEDRISKSFSLVNERLEQVAKGLGEMSTLASGVGDLKKVLSNVKTRGILGESQLAAILSEILAPQQYLCDVATVKGSSNRVEFAIKFPNEEDEPVLLPIDSKFPLEDYERLLNAYDEGNTIAIEEFWKKIETSLKKFAKDIKEKYIHIPETTEFGILFLPIEGLYAEAVKRGMVEILQREYQIALAGPTTMAALLNSLQMGFRTLAIQQRSNEVWKILAGVKDEFNNFAGVLTEHQKRLTQANDELDKLVGVRTRKLAGQLNKIDLLQDSETVVVTDQTEQDK